MSLYVSVLPVFIPKLLNQWNKNNNNETRELLILSASLLRFLFFMGRVLKNALLHANSVELAKNFN